MSSFNLQTGQIRAALIAAGIPAEAATGISQILGNSAQAMRHTGEITHDKTPPNLRFVDPDSRRHSLTEVDFRPGDPDHRGTRVRPSEDRAQPTPENPLSSTVAPQQTKAQKGVRAGQYIAVSATGDSATVGLKVSGAGDLLFADPRSDSLVAKAYRAEANGLGGNVRMSIDVDNNEVVWKLLIDPEGALGSFEGGVPVVTGVEYVQGSGLRVKTRQISAWFSGGEKESLIPVEVGDVVTALQFGGGALVGLRARISTFEAGGASPSVIPVTDCEE